MWNLVLLIFLIVLYYANHLLGQGQFWWFSVLTKRHKHKGEFKYCWAPPPPRGASYSVCLEYGPVIYISNKFPGDAGPKTTLENLKCILPMAAKNPACFLKATQHEPPTFLKHVLSQWSG